MVIVVDKIESKNSQYNINIHFLYEFVNLSIDIFRKAIDREHTHIAYRIQNSTKERSFFFTVGCCCSCFFFVLFFLELLLLLLLSLTQVSTSCVYSPIYFQCEHTNFSSNLTHSLSKLILQKFCVAPLLSIFNICNTNHNGSVCLQKWKSIEKYRLEHLEGKKMVQWHLVFGYGVWFLVLGDLKRKFERKGRNGIVSFIL